jgi:hypothetical protein
VPLWAYAAACVALPASWALFMFHAFGWLDRKRAGLRRPPVDDDVPPADYMI